MDTILIKGFEVFANHGVLPEENTLGQKFVVDAKLSLSVSEAAEKDELEKTVNYAAVCDDIQRFLQQNTFKLIETAADRLARFLLVKYKPIDNISLCIKKPWAPVRHSLEYLGVSVERGRAKAYLSLGSNIGDSEGYLNNAIKALDTEACAVTKVSPFYKTKPVGGVEQDDFLNCCVEVSTVLSPYELLGLVNKIELDNGRERIIHWGPRTLDIDIVLYGSCVMSDERLTIPHKEMAKREFVLRPLNDIAPYAMHPVLNRSVVQLFNEITGE